MNDLLFLSIIELCVGLGGFVTACFFARRTAIVVLGVVLGGLALLCLGIVLKHDGMGRMLLIGLPALMLMACAAGAAVGWLARILRGHYPFESWQRSMIGWIGGIGVAIAAMHFQFNLWSEQFAGCSDNTELPAKLLVNFAPRRGPSKEFLIDTTSPDITVTAYLPQSDGLMGHASYSGTHLSLDGSGYVACLASDNFRKPLEVVGIKLWAEAVGQTFELGPYGGVGFALTTQNVPDLHYKDGTEMHRNGYTFFYQSQRSLTRRWFALVPIGDVFATFSAAGDPNGIPIDRADWTKSILEQTLFRPETAPLR